MDLLISDSCDVVIEDKSTGATFATTESQLNSIAQTLGIDEGVFGGIGVRQIARVRGQKELTTTYRNALYNKEMLAATQGVEVIKNKTVVIKKIKEDVNVENGEVTFTDDTESDDVVLRNGYGETTQATIESEKIVVPPEFAKDGETINVIYSTEVQGDSVEIDAQKFSTAKKITYHTIAYNRNSEVVKDIYIILYHAIPSGEFELALEMGTPIAPELNFDILAEPGRSIMAEIIEVDREDDGGQGTP